MNGDIPAVPVTTLAGLASLTQCKYNITTLQHYNNINTTEEGFVEKTAAIFVDYSHQGNTVLPNMDT